jgi:DNA-binding PadR family transcriptional regulator
VTQPSRPVRSRRPSPQTVAVLGALAGQPSTWRYGYELGQEVGLKAGSLYPILIRLCDRGWLEASWETDPPAGRPARHLYRLTGAGLQLAAQLLTEPASTTSPAGRASEHGRRQQRRGQPDVAASCRAAGPAGARPASLPIIRGAW